LAITAFLACSVLLHASCFYLFQVVYPPAVALLSPPARISLISGNTEEGRSVLRWVDAEDPALASATLLPPEAKTRTLPKLQHIPSYATENPRLKPAPPMDLALRTPSSQPPSAVPVSPRPAHEPLGIVPTHVVFSDEFTAFGVPNFSPAKFSAATAEPPQSIRFRIAIGARGEVRHCFPQNSSGDAALDEQARQHILRCRFAQTGAANRPDDQTLTWGEATIDWGNDIVPPAAASTSSPAPP